MTKEKFPDINQGSEYVEYIPINKIEKHFKSLTESVNSCDGHRAILISNLLGCEEMTIDNVRKLRDLAKRFNDECACIPKRELKVQ